MALVRESACDFVLYPQDRAYYDPLHSSFDENLPGLDCNLRSPLAMQQPFADRAFIPFSDCSNTPTYNYYTASDMTVDGPKEHTRPYQQRYTPSGSASPSFPQSLDHPPSTFSSASGASGQSTASSAAGSPYSLATHNRINQESWNEPQQGLGIAQDILHSGSFTHDPLSSGGLEGELCFQEGKFSDSFVGEWKICSGHVLSGSFNTCVAPNSQL